MAIAADARERNAPDGTDLARSVVLPPGFDLTRPGPMRAVLEHAPVAIAVTTGPEHRYAYANRHYRLLAGQGDGDLVGRTAAEVWEGDAVHGVLAVLDRVLSGGEAYSAREFQTEACPGRPAVVSDIDLLPIFDEAGAPTGILTIAMDVTERVRARRAAEQRERDIRVADERLRLAIDAARLGTWEWLVGTNVALWSARQKEIWGMAPDEPESYERWHAGLHPDDRDRVLADIQRVTDPAHAGDLRTEHRVVRPDGSVRWVESHGRMVFEGEGEQRRPARLIGTLKDVTDRKLAEQALAETVKGKELLLREVNHRVKNSLQMVASVLGLQQAAVKDPAAAAQFDDARNRVMAIALVHERLYKGMQVQRVELGAYLGEMCADLHRASGAGERGVTVEVAAEPLSISTDRAVQLGLVANELITNALKYAYPDGPGAVRVRLEAAGEGRMALTVADTGVGLPEGFGSKRPTSLGMVLVNALTKQLGGTLDVQRRDPGTGFRLEFPEG